MAISIFLIFIFLPFISPIAWAYNGNVVVYVTNTGYCYHRNGCTYLESKIPMKLEDAAKEYQDCSRCHPPILGEDNPNDTDRYYSNEERRELARIEEQENRRIKKEKFRRAMKVVVPSSVVLLLLWLSYIYVISSKAHKEHDARCCGDLPGGMPGMPFGTIIGDDGLPKQIKSKNGWGPLYTVYVSRTGDCFHRSPKCTVGAYFPIHVVYIGNRTPCKKCRPIKIDISWYINYKNTKKEEKLNEQVFQLPVDTSDYKPDEPNKVIQKYEKKESALIMDSENLSMPEYWLNINISGRNVLVCADNPTQLEERIKKLEEEEEKKREDALRRKS